MTDQLEELFARHYLGRHAPADAFWWLEHPDRPAPSGAEPPQWAFLEAADGLEAKGHLVAATAMRRALEALLDSDRRVALHALRAAEQELGEQ